MKKRFVILTILGGLFLYFLMGTLFKGEITVSFFKKSLNEVVEKELEGTQGTYAIAIKNLKNEQSYFYNADKSFEAGSLYKLWVLASAYNQIEKGKLKEDEVLSSDIPALNAKFNISKDEAEQRDGTISLTVKDAMNQMITISHNYAALLLTDRVKISNISQYLKDHGFNNSNIGEPPKTTALDTAMLLEKVYKGELVNEENTKKILEMLKRQKLNEGLPKYLPKGVQIGHKTGDIGWFKHEAGIVFTKNGDYIIVVLSESDSPKSAQERIAQLSRAVYEYFTN